MVHMRPLYGTTFVPIGNSKYNHGIACIVKPHTIPSSQHPTPAAIAWVFLSVLFLWYFRSRKRRPCRHFAWYDSTLILCRNFDFALKAVSHFQNNGQKTNNLVVVQQSNF